MNKILKGCYFFLSVIIVILALLFCIIEGRLLFSGDWTLYEFAWGGAVRYLCRLLMAIAALAIGLLPFVNLKVKGDKIVFAQKLGAVLLLLMSVVILIFATNYVGIVVFLVAGFYLVLNKLCF
ncbi:MAG: hypothetical protein E7283_10600 [Lachnospiraceae bacterium]|nr:hypothetical protein [Lachnospiraceae bacterium]